MLTTHYLDEAARLCDRLVIMDKGTILVEGAPADLVKKFVGDEIVEVETSAEVLACLTAHNIPHEVTGDTIQIATTRPGRSPRSCSTPASQKRCSPVWQRLKMCS